MHCTWLTHFGRASLKKAFADSDVLPFPILAVSGFHTHTIHNVIPKPSKFTWRIPSQKPVLLPAWTARHRSDRAAKKQAHRRGAACWVPSPLAMAFSWRTSREGINPQLNGLICLTLYVGHWLPRSRLPLIGGKLVTAVTKETGLRLWMDAFGALWDSQAVGKVSLRE